MVLVLTAAPDYLAISVFEFLGHFLNLLTLRNFKLRIDYNDYSRVIGYSCRSLFELTLEHFSKEDLVIATTPIHHTSFRNIIERFVKPENIYIIEFNENYNEIKNLPELEKCDLVVITHLFGQDLDLSILEEFKQKHKCLVIEDRVQGGTLEKEFSNNVVDIAIYSMAMDKRPIALGGGFMFVRKKHEEFIQSITTAVEALPKEKRLSRLKEFIKKIPTFLLYNSKLFLFFFIGSIKLLRKFTKKVGLLEFGASYRKKNPGFSHFNYMLRPSDATLKSMYGKFNHYKKMEERYTKKFQFFKKELKPEVLTSFFPWFREVSLTPYNTIVTKPEQREDFLNFMNDRSISCILNPTYKLFNHEYSSKEKDTKFNDGISYLPSLANMTKKEIKYLADVIKEFYDKIK